MWLSLRFHEEASVALWQASPKEIGAAVGRGLEATPLGRVPVTDLAVTRWEYASPVFDPGYLERLRAFLARSQRSPRLAFAGDYLVGPFAEGALSSGLRAASEVLQTLQHAPAS